VLRCELVRHVVGETVWPIVEREEGDVARNYVAARSSATSRCDVIALRFGALDSCCMGVVAK